MFFILPAWGLSNAAATLVGQNLGAKEPGRAEKSVLLTTKYNAIFMGGVMLLFYSFHHRSSAFLQMRPKYTAYGVSCIADHWAGYIFYGIGMVMIQALNGAGDSKTPTLYKFGWLLVFPDSFSMDTCKRI